MQTMSKNYKIKSVCQWEREGGGERGGERGRGGRNDGRERIIKKGKKKLFRRSKEN